MILGTGIDIVELARISHVYSRFGDKFLERFLNENERRLMTFRPVEWLGGRFAAKEAASKALGTGFRNGLSMLDIEIATDTLGKPHLIFLNAAKTLATSLGVANSHVSISHERAYAVAMVILDSQ